MSGQTSWYDVAKKVASDTLGERNADTLEKYGRAAANAGRAAAHRIGDAINESDNNTIIKARNIASAVKKAAETPSTAESSSPIKLVSGKCPNCGANLEVRSDIDTFFCQYCGSKIIISNQSREVLNAKLQEKRLAQKSEMADKVLDSLNKRSMRKEEERRKRQKSARIGLIFSVLFLILAMGGLYLLEYKEKKESFAEEEALLALSQVIQQNIDNGQWDEALVNANQLQYTSGYSNEVKRKWNNTREAYISIINEGKKESTEVFQPSVSYSIPELDPNQTSEKKPPEEKIVTEPIPENTATEILAETTEEVPAVEEVTTDVIYLQKGDMGPEVYKVQELLHSLGFLAYGTDGDYGDMTLNAVSAFQTSHGFDVTGKLTVNQAKELGVTTEEINKYLGIQDNSSGENTASAQTSFANEQKEDDSLQAFKSIGLNYTLYYLFDFNSNTVYEFNSSESSYITGSFSGTASDFVLGNTINFNGGDSNWNEKISIMHDSMTMTDPYGTKVHFTKCSWASANELKNSKNELTSY